MVDPQLLPALDIILVEDNEDDVEQVRRVLARSGLDARLLIAMDGQEARDVLSKAKRASEAPGKGTQRYRLVLLDLHLPQVDGRDLLRWMKAEPALRSVPVVVLTGSAAQELIRECMELGCQMYILKPIDIADIANIVWGVGRFWTGPAVPAQKAA